MAHIHTKPGQHDFTVSAYIVRDGMDELRVLLHMHKKLHRLLQPGGHVELAENPWAALAHELLEETGYTLGDLEVMQPEVRIKNAEGIIIHPQPLFINTHKFSDDTDHFHTDISYLLLAHDAPTRQPNEDESKDLRWLSEREIEALAEDVIYDNTKRVAIEILDHFMNNLIPTSARDFQLSAD